MPEVFKYALETGNFTWQNTHTKMDPFISFIYIVIRVMFSSTFTTGHIKIIKIEKYVFYPD